MTWLYLFGIALGTMQIIEWGQNIPRQHKTIQRHPLSEQWWTWWKITLTCGFAFGLAFLLVPGPWKIQVLVGLGASGLAALFHAADSCLRYVRDEKRQTVILRWNQNRRSRV
jgi:hypothetical protein